MYRSPVRRPLITGDKDLHDITVDIARPIETRANKWWWSLFIVSVIAMLWGFGCIAHTIGTGVGVWGLNNTVGWAWDITNFVWWVGIDHTGTLISAVLLLFGQNWNYLLIDFRSDDYIRCNAGWFISLIHMGRIWVGYWVFPLPNQYGPLWVNFNSPLLWDVFAISTYFSVSLVFWYMGLIPDFAMIKIEL